MHYRGMVFPDSPRPETSSGTRPGYKGFRLENVYLLPWVEQNY